MSRAIGSTQFVCVTEPMLPVFLEKLGGSAQNSVSDRCAGSRFSALGLQSSSEPHLIARATQSSARANKP